MKEKTRTALFWFILIQPFLDLYWLYNGKLATILPFTLPTIIRILAVGILIGMFFSKKDSWQKLNKQKWLIAYLILLVVYSIFHLLHVRHFNSVNPNDYNYSTISEIFYLIGDFVKDLEQNSIPKNYTDIDDQLYKIKDIVKLYPILSVYSINKAVNEKKLSYTQIGKTRYYKKQDIEKFISANKKKAFLLDSFYK